MTESILIIGGYGVVGRRIAADLAPEFPGGVIVAGRHLDQAERAAATIGYAVRGRQVDVRLPSSIAAALHGVSIAVNCIDQPERGLLWAAARQGLGYTDITPHLTDLSRDAYERVDATARASGARIILGSGLVPGISSVIVRSLADALGGADRIETSVLLSADDVSGAASFDSMMQELTMAFTIRVEGADKPARPYTKPSLICYPAPVGTRRGYLFPFSDQVLYPRTMGGHCHRRPGRAAADSCQSAQVAGRRYGPWPSSASSSAARWSPCPGTTASWTFGAFDLSRGDRCP